METNSTFLLRISNKTKNKLREIADKERRSINSLILLLIDEKILEEKDDRGK